MNPKQAEKLVEIRTQLGDLIVKAKPEHTVQWEALEKMTAAHKVLRSIDITELLQLSLGLTADEAT